MFTKHGTPLSQGEIWDFAADFFKLMPHDLPPESVRYWRAHRGEAAKLMREFLLKPGARIMEIDRSIPIRREFYREESFTPRPTQEGIRLVNELDLSLVRFVDLRRDANHVFGPYPKYRALDVYVAMTLLNRQKDLPSEWKKVKTWPSFALAGNPRLRFDGTTFDRKPGQEGFEQMIPAIQLNNAGDWEPSHEVPMHTFHRNEGLLSSVSAVLEL